MYCNPVVGALYKQDAAACSTALAVAEASVDSGAEADERQARQYVLTQLRFQAASNLLDVEHRREALSTALIELAQPPAGPVSDLIQACCELIVRCIGDTREHLMLTAGEIDSLIARIPEADRDAEIWYYVSSWALEHDNPQYIRAAYETLVSRDSGYLTHDVWLRVNLAYLLLEGRAQERDVIETFKIYRHPNQMARFLEFYWPRIMATGLDTPEVRAALAAKQQELSASGASWPQTPV